MKKNIGQIDRLLRIVVGSLLLYFAVAAGQPWGFIGIIPFITGTIGWCPLYRLMGMTTTCKSCVHN